MVMIYSKSWRTDAKIHSSIVESIIYSVSALLKLFSHLHIHASNICHENLLPLPCGDPKFSVFKV